MCPQPMLTREEEDVLVKWITTVAKERFPITKTELLDSLQHIINELNLKNLFVDNRPVRTWFLAFLKHHPNITSRMAQNLTSSRTSKTNMRIFLNKPKSVFNLVENAFFLIPKGKKVVCVKGEKNVYQQVNADEKEFLVVLVTGNAIGDLAPTLVVFKYERVLHVLADSVPEHWVIGKSETGWMTGSLFFKFITNMFYPFLVQKKIHLHIILFH
ncbi:hypothetical protein PR048_026274 [Dryococelus australis]|uniref:HTH CENPB-type domain-containing protein n=1 Tax=Dryococelus australis TaxID=614101 RepID=A0ABQ9GKX8_9NEOP|nr:hypothetical protein PR048_026274 [Dryococelus australis]